MEFVFVCLYYMCVYRTYSDVRKNGSYVRFEVIITLIWDLGQSSLTYCYSEKCAACILGAKWYRNMPPSSSGWKNKEMQCLHVQNKIKTLLSYPKIECG
jgi:hypothetical protein